jgi:hypothetical protein
MPFSILAFIVLGCAYVQGDGARIEGVAVNGTQDGKPLAGAEVILRAGEEGALPIIAKTVTDRNGRFVFDRLPAGPGMIFLPGVNHHGIHYPGLRMRLPAGTPMVKLVAFDAVASPSPLVADVHEIDIQINVGVLEVTETLVIRNPSLATYVGQSENGAAPTTLGLTIPDGFERVTFHSEFNGRHFKLQDKRLVTDLPWTPGTREVKFTYHLPIEDGKRVLEWSANVPCANHRLRVRGENADRFQCNLPRAGPFASPAWERDDVLFASSEPAVTGHIVRLQLGHVPTPWVSYLRWSALAALAILIAATAAWRTARREGAKPAATQLVVQ